MKKNTDTINKRLLYILNHLENRGNKSMGNFVADLANKLFLSVSTIWKDIKKLRNNRHSFLN